MPGLARQVVEAVAGRVALQPGEARAGAAEGAAPVAREVDGESELVLGGARDGGRQFEAALGPLHGAGVENDLGHPVLTILVVNTDIVVTEAEWHNADL